MNETEWIICPICGRKTHNKIQEDTILKNFPLAVHSHCFFHVTKQTTVYGLYP